jgi:predicted porin
MKKSLVALAALAVVGAASAQSSVSIWGAVDASYNYASADIVGGSQSKSSLQNSQLGSSKLGFSGLEDLGGGLKAKFWLEAGLANDTGAGKGSNANNQTTGGLTSGGVAATSSTSALNGTQGIVFQRRSYVGLLGNFGEVQLGRQYVNTFLGVQAAVDPFGTNGPADSTQMMLTLGAKVSVATITNASNMITYITPDMGGFSGNAQMFMGENTSGAANSDDGGGYSLTGQYANGPLFVSLGQQQTKYASTATLGDYTLRSLSASYDFGVAKLVYTNAHEEVARLADTPKNDSNMIGVIVPFGAANFKATYIRSTNSYVAGAADASGELFGLGVDYALSKRTSLYATFASVKNSDGGNLYSTGGVSGTLDTNGSSSNLAVGVYHKF